MEALTLTTCCRSTSCRPAQGVLHRPRALPGSLPRVRLRASPHAALREPANAVVSGPGSPAHRPARRPRSGAAGARPVQPAAAGPRSAPGGLIIRVSEEGSLSEELASWQDLSGEQLCLHLGAARYPANLLTCRPRTAASRAHWCSSVLDAPPDARSPSSAFRLTSP